MIRSRQRRKAVAGRVAEISTARRARPATTGMQIHLGQLVSWDQEGTGPLVDYPGNPRGPVRARLTGEIGAAHAPAASLVGREVVLLVDPRHRSPPVLLGLVTPLGHQSSTAGDLEARVDGKRVELDARDEIVLRCGDASITLRRNGRISIRGVDVETRAAGMNRIRGGSVDIN